MHKTLLAQENVTSQQSIHCNSIHSMHVADLGHNDKCYTYWHCSERDSQKAVLPHQGIQTVSASHV